MWTIRPLDLKPSWSLQEKLRSKRDDLEQDFVSTLKYLKYLRDCPSKGWTENQAVDKSLSHPQAWTHTSPGFLISLD